MVGRLDSETREGVDQIGEGVLTNLESFANGVKISRV